MPRRYVSGRAAWPPDVLADRHADAYAAKDDRPRRRPRRRHALLVKNAIIGQIDLEAHRFDAAAVEERHRVVELAVLDPGQAHQRRRPAVGCVAREILAGGAASLLKRRLQQLGPSPPSCRPPSSGGGVHSRPRRARGLRNAIAIRGQKEENSQRINL